jgi:hypothetical protein
VRHTFDQRERSVESDESLVADGGRKMWEDIAYRFCRLAGGYAGRQR